MAVAPGWDEGRDACPSSGNKLRPAIAQVVPALRERVCGSDPDGPRDLEDSIMLYWSVVFFVVAIAAAFFGFFGIASTAAGIAKILFFIFAVLFVFSLITGLRGRSPRV